MANNNPGMRTIAGLHKSPGEVETQGIRIAICTARDGFSALDACRDEIKSTKQIKSIPSGHP